MNILFLTDNFPPEVNAIASRVYERALYWQKWGHNVTIVTCAPNFPEGKVYDGYKNKWHFEEKIEGIRVIRVKTFIAPNKGIILRTLDQMSFMFTAILAARHVKKQDIVVATSPPLFAAIAGKYIAKRHKRPFLLEVSDLWPKSILALGAIKNKSIINFLGRIELGLYAAAARIVLLSDAFKRDLTSRDVPDVKLDVILNGAEITKYKPRAADQRIIQDNALKGKFTIGYIGTIGMAHNLKNAITAMDILQNNNRIALLMVGEGAESASLKSYTAEKKVENVIFFGKKTKSEVCKYWSVCDIALIHLKNVPAMAEVIPSKIFEAMAMGLPILLVAPEGEASRLVTAHDVGFWVEAGDPNTLANTIEDLSTNTELLNRYKMNALLAAQHFSRETQAKKFVRCIEKACEPSHYPQT